MFLGRRFYGHNTFGVRKGAIAYNLNGTGRLLNMKFSITKDALLEGLSSVQNVVPSLTTLPILSNVLIEGGDGVLRLTTTDLDLGVRRSVEASVERSGAITLPARRLLSIVRELPEGMVSFEANGNNVAFIQSAAVHYKLLGLAAADFPPLAGYDGASDFRVPQKDLRDALKRTCYAASDDQTRFVLNGLLFSFKAGKLTLVATDGKRLALADLEVEFPVSCERDVIVPSKAVEGLVRMLDEEGEVKICLSEDQIVFEATAWILISKLIEGTFPQYQQVIPSRPETSIAVPREAFMLAVRRAALLADAKSRSVKLVFSNGTVEIIAVTPDVGEAKESCAVAYDGPAISVAFNPDFLVAPLKNLPADDVSLDLTEETSPGVIRTEDSFLYVLMPLRLS